MSEPAPDLDLPVAAAGEGAASAPPGGVGRDLVESLYTPPPVTPDAPDDMGLPQVDEATYKSMQVGGATGKAGDLLSEARKFLGTPYVWGGTSPLGFDCSGFTQYVYRQFGIDLPRVSYQQAGAGKRIGMDQAKPGDLVFWDTSSRNNGADHVAIYLGNGQVIHAPKPGDSIKISKVWGNPWAAQMNL